MGTGKLQRKCDKHARILSAGNCPGCAVDKGPELATDIQSLLPKECGFVLILWDDAQNVACIGPNLSHEDMGNILRDVAHKVSPPAIVVPGRS